MSKSEKSLTTLIDEYAEAAAAHGRASWEESDYKKANRNHDIVADIRCELMERGEEGRMALLGLLSHPDPHVRTWAAAHSLEFAPERAEATLVEVIQSDVGIVSFTAEITLEQWKKGELTFPERLDRILRGIGAPKALARFQISRPGCLVPDTCQY